MATLTKQQMVQNIEAMESQGASQREIQSYLDSLSTDKAPTQAKSFTRPIELGKSIVGGFKEEIGGAATDIQQAAGRFERGEQGLLRTGTTALAQGAQAGLSGFFRGVIDLGSAVVPDFIENPLRRKLGNEFEEFIESDTGKELVGNIETISKKFDTLDPKNQQLIKDAIDTGLTALDIGTAGVARTGTKKVASELAQRTGTKADDLLRTGQEELMKKTERQLGELIIDDTTPTKRGELATRTKEGGFFTGREVTLTPFEREAAQQLLQTPGVRANRSALFNLNAVVKEVGKQADALKQSIRKEGFIAPRQEFKARLTSRLDDLVQTDPIIVGDGERMAQRIFDKAKAFIDAHEGTGVGQLEARQAFDAWALTKKPKAPEKLDAFSTAWHSARDEMTDFLISNAKKTNVKASLRKQSLLLTARDVLQTKAAKEASTGFGRVLNKAIDVLGTKNKIVQVLATVTGIGGLGAAATFAPAVAVAGGITGAGLLTLKALRSPQTKIALGNALKRIEKALPTATPSEKKVLNELKDEVKALLDDNDIDLTPPSPRSTNLFPIGEEGQRGFIKAGGSEVDNTLVQEARKYKSADEFVEAQVKNEGVLNVFHGSRDFADYNNVVYHQLDLKADPALREANTGGNRVGLSTSKTYKTAKDFAFETGGQAVTKYVIRNDDKVYKLRGKTLDDLTEAETKELSKKYNAIYDVDNIGGESEVRLLNYDNVIDTKRQMTPTGAEDITEETKSQLTDIWKQAQKTKGSTVVNPLTVGAGVGAGIAGASALSQ